MVFTSCGARCKHFQMSGPKEATEYHLQGNTWIGPASDNFPTTIDNITLPGSKSSWDYQLVKVG